MADILPEKWMKVMAVTTTVLDCGSTYSLDFIVKVGHWKDVYR